MPTPDKPRQCPHCRTEVAATDRVCWHCYRALPAPAPPTPVPTHHRRRRVSTTPIIAGLLIVALGGYFWHVRSSPTTALMAYLRAQQSGDVKTAYRLLSVRSREMIRPEDMATREGESKSGPVFVVRDVEHQNGSAKITLDATATPADGSATSTMTCCMYMVREEGGWRVDMVRTSQAQAGNVMIGGQGWFRMWTGTGRR
jgi:hypothetical protein